MSSSCAAKKIRYSCRTQGPVHPLYIGDALKLQQVILNLVGNAVKFTADGGEIVLTVREQPAGDPRQLCFLVQDTGCGISPEFLPHLFDPFAQERRTLNNQIHGTGLGLAICPGHLGHFKLAREIGFENGEIAVGLVLRGLVKGLHQRAHLGGISAHLFGRHAAKIFPEQAADDAHGAQQDHQQADQRSQ